MRAKPIARPKTLPSEEAIPTSRSPVTVASRDTSLTKTTTSRRLPTTSAGRNEASEHATNTAEHDGESPEGALGLMTEIADRDKSMPDEASESSGEEDRELNETAVNQMSAQEATSPATMTALSDSKILGATLIVAHTLRLMNV